MNEEEREQERMGLREDMRKVSSEYRTCRKLLDLAGVPPGELVERVRWVVREYMLPGWHKLGSETADAGTTKGVE